MKIGQPFYRINQNYLLSTFNEHKFSVLFVLGIEQSTNNNVVLECFASDLTVSESLNANRASNGYNVPLEYDADAFSKLSDSEQNTVFFDQFGFVANPEDLRTEFNTQVETEIEKERDRIQQWTDKLDEIEESIQNPDSGFISKVLNWAPIYFGSTISFSSTYNGTDVSDQTNYTVNGELLPIGTTTFDPQEIGLYNVHASYDAHSANYSFTVSAMP